LETAWQWLWDKWGGTFIVGLIRTAEKALFVTEIDNTSDWTKHTAPSLPSIHHRLLFDNSHNTVSNTTDKQNNIYRKST